MGCERVLGGLLLALPAAWMGCLGTSPAGTGSVATAEEVAQVILREEAGWEGQEGLSAEGVVVAACAHFDPQGNPLPPFQVWRISGGRFAGADGQVLRDALGPDRSLWPPATYVFSLKPKGGGGLQVEVATHYSRGIAETSRGGNAQRWTLRRRGKGWEVTEKVRTLQWD